MSVPCPVCGSADDWVIQSWFDEEGVDAQVCRRCGNGWIGDELPAPDADPWNTTLAEARDRFERTGEYPDD